MSEHPKPTQNFARWVEDKFSGTDEAISYNENARLVVRTEPPNSMNGRYLVSRQRYGSIPMRRDPHITSEIAISMGENQPVQLEMVQFGEATQPTDTRDTGFFQININEADKDGRSITLKGRVENRFFRVEYDSTGRISLIVIRGPGGKEIPQDYTLLSDEDRELVSQNRIERLSLTEGRVEFSLLVRPFLRLRDIVRPPVIKDGKAVGVTDILASLGPRPNLADNPSTDDAWLNLDWQKVLRMELILKQAGVVKPFDLQLPKAA
ncbi:MAG: hypothetical protein M1405_00660 [Patescibacteria group bacterium]|nr:hypothetical protein [Patescibacteria group bacterium]